MNSPAKLFSYASKKEKSAEEYHGTNGSESRQWNLAMLFEALKFDKTIKI